MNLGSFSYSRTCTIIVHRFKVYHLSDLTLACSQTSPVPQFPINLQARSASKLLDPHSIQYEIRLEKPTNMALQNLTRFESLLLYS